MDDWERRMTPRPTPAPRLDLIEVCWCVVGPRGKRIDCGIYRTDVGLEVRAHVDGRLVDLLRSQFAIEIGAARDIAETWKATAIGKGWRELTGGGDDGATSYH